MKLNESLLDFMAVPTAINSKEGTLNFIKFQLWSVGIWFLEQLKYEYQWKDSKDEVWNTNIKFNK